jgi:hypothetical protein
MKNNKVFKIALQNAKPNVDQLLQVAEATENPEIAIEILLGVYEMPEIRSTSNKDRINNEYPSNRFVSFNPMTNRVTFEHNMTKTDYGWFLPDADASKDNVISKAGYNDDEKALADYCNLTGANIDNTRKNFRSILARKKYIVEILPDKTTSDCELSNWQSADWIENYALAV